MDRGSERRYRFGPFDLDAGGHTLRRGGETVPLKPKVFDLLCLLVENAGRLMTKRELMDRLWGDVIVEEANLTQSVYELRKALADERDGPPYIETVPRRGYRFTAGVGEHPHRGTTPEPAQRLRSIAVLPFSAFPGADRDQSLELGIAETLLTDLSRIPGLEVRPAESIKRYREVGFDSITAGRELGVDALVSGSIQRAGDRLRVTARLTRVEDATVLWADRFDESIDDMFSVQDSICERVVAALSLELPRGPNTALAARHSDNPEAHRLFLKCRYHWHKWTPDNWLQAIEWGRQAIACEPSHAPAHSWVAASYCALGIAGVMPPRTSRQQASEFVERALQLDEMLAEAHEVKGAIQLFFGWQWQEAELSLQRAVELNPSSGGARDLRSLLMIVTGQTDAAIGAVDRALEVDPLSLIVNTDAGIVRYYARRYEAAVEQLRRTLELDPWFAHARFALGYALIQTGEIEGALEEINAAVEYSGRAPESSADLAYVMAISGDRSGAEDILEMLLEHSESRFVDPFSVALVQVGLGSVDAAFSSLERAFEEGSRELIFLRADPIFDHLQADPRFIDLVRRVGL